MRFARDADGGVLLRAIVANCMEQVLANASELATGSTDDEHVHQMRVGLRRLRTALRELRALAPGIDPAWDTALAQAFRALGEHRDHATMAPMLQQRMQAEGGPPLAWPESARELSAPAAIVRSAPLQDTLLAVLGFLHADPAEALSPRKTRAVVVRRLEQLHRKAAGDGPKFTRLSLAAQHRVRKRFKRLRYLAELVRPLFAQRDADALVARLKPLQDALGDYQDLVVAHGLWAERAQREPAALFGVGWLTAHQRPQAAACEAACEGYLSGIKRFWHRS